MVRTTTPANVEPEIRAHFMPLEQMRRRPAYTNATDRAAADRRRCRPPACPFEGMRNRAAGFAAISAAMCSNRRRRPSRPRSSSTASVDCTPATPPHDARKSPVVLQRRVGRRMIGRDEIDAAVEHFAPEHRLLVVDDAAEARTWRRRRCVSRSSSVKNR